MPLARWMRRIRARTHQLNPKRTALWPWSKMVSRVGSVTSPISTRSPTPKRSWPWTTQCRVWPAAPKSSSRTRNSFPQCPTGSRSRTPISWPCETTVSFACNEAYCLSQPTRTKICLGLSKWQIWMWRPIANLFEESCRKRKRRRWTFRSTFPSIWMENRRT